MIPGEEHRVPCHATPEYNVRARPPHQRLFERASLPPEADKVSLEKNENIYQKPRQRSRSEW